MSLKQTQDSTMTSNESSLLESSQINCSVADDEYVSCQICLINYNDKDRIPKYLSCHHIFCLFCILDLVKRSTSGVRVKTISCPKCRSGTRIEKNKAENLPTCHMALRFVSLTSEVIQHKESYKIQWCSSCNSAVNSNCTELNHKLLDSKELHNSYSLGLETALQRTRQVYKTTMDDWQSVQYVNQAILSWLCRFVTEMKKREASNSAEIVHLESLKVPEQLDVPQDETDIPGIIARFNQLITDVQNKYQGVTSCQEKARETLDIYKLAQEKVMKTTKSAQPLTDLRKWIDELTAVQPVTDTHDLIDQSCIPVLSFLMSLSSDNKQSASPIQSGQSLSTQSNAAATANPEPTASCSGSSHQSSSKRSAEEDCANTPSQKRGKPGKSNDSSTADSDNRCFFKFMLNGSVTEQVIFQLDSASAPDMVSAFLDYCTRSWASGDGYLGTTVKGGRNSTSGPPNVPSALIGGQVHDYQNQIFNAGPSNLPVKKGALRFVLKEDNPWGLMMTPEFEIVLTDLDKESKRPRTTVFGEVITGLDIVELISKQPVDNPSNPCTIFECGLL